ncbi:MAG: RNA polymerase sigma factor [Planctomycetota bacterium]|nr:RNA polymerase sigma factor [Planctomycetota bacterium]
MSTGYSPDPSDETLVERATNGDRHALEALVERHQAWIYNLALRMVHSPQDAEDITQEVLLKMVTKLSSFEGRAAFRTWLYRIVKNHVLNMNRRPIERMVTTFAAYGDQLDAIHDYDPPDESTLPVELHVVVEEAKIGCMMGMLLCLNREQRLVYILAELFGVTDRIGSDIMEVTPANFRQRLSRARRDLHNFMDQKCGLVRKENPCRCAQKTKGFIQQGIVDPDNLLFSRGHMKHIREVSESRSDELEAVEAEYATLYRDHPFAKGVDSKQLVDTWIRRGELRAILEL